ncbi:MAG: nuclear transport factor 2 family protein [Gammaproteobacteria bacterium]|jgi:hypothetical protein|nr:nuclear transport factor 2 family protein [Gammaproteobacteria bacterium]
MTNVAKLNISAVSEKGIVAKIMDFYSEFSKESISSIDELYTKDIEFIDPVHTLIGSLALKAYFKRMASNMLHYEMRYLDIVESEGSAHLSWEMTFAHKSLNGGQAILVRGMSLIKFTSKVYYHEDSYDLGALVYEHVPLFGKITKFLKSRMQ